MNTSTAYKRLSWAFKAQNFRALELDALVQPRSISLDSVPPDLVEALNGMLRESTNWSRIGEQIALLRERLNESGNYLWDVYLGASSQKLRVIVVCGFGGTLSDQNFKTKFDYTWVIMQSLESHIRQFQISPELIALLDAVRQQYLTSTNPVIQGNRRLGVVICCLGKSERRSYRCIPRSCHWWIDVRFIRQAKGAPLRTHSVGPRSPAVPRGCSLGLSARPIQ